MSERVTYIRLRWPGGVNTFRLRPFRPTAQGRRHQTPFDGLMHDGERAVLKRFAEKTWSSLDVAQTLFAGLAGGGEFTPERVQDPNPGEALRRHLEGGSIEVKGFPQVHALIGSALDAHPLASFVPTVQAVLCAAIYGIPAVLADKGLDAAAIDFGDALNG